MATKEDIQVVKTLAVPFIIGTIFVVGIALLGRIMTGRK